MRLSLVFFLLPLFLAAQPDRIPQNIDDSRTVVLSGHRNRFANQANDAGPAAPDLSLAEIVVHFRPTSSQQQDLDALLAQLQDPKSPNYHRWLTPEQFGARFSLSVHDYSRASAWLSAHGFQLAPASRSRGYILFQGSAAQVQTAFGAPVRRYRTNGQLHYSIAADPSLPAALASVVSSITGLDDFLPASQSHLIAPSLTLPNGSHSLAPDDIAAIYDIAPLLQAGFDGAGQRLVVVGQSRPNTSDMAAFRVRYNLPAQKLQTTLVPGSADPGVTGSLAESDLDVQWSGAIARNANIQYVYATNALVALIYAVDQNFAPIITSSYSYACESQFLIYLPTYRFVAQQANAQGITWVNSAGDTGPAACDLDGSPEAQGGLSVLSFPAIPEVTAVGGSEFDEGSGSFWSAANTANSASANGYIPEKVWNDTSTLNALWAGGGGISVFFPRPIWQTGPGVPNGNTRVVPDVSLSASNHDPYNIVYAGVSTPVYGTSASAPVLAGMLALLNQYLNKDGLGNVNPALYSLAQTTPGAFHDILNGDNNVPCASASPDCSSGSFGYPAASGYDLATGLGSVDLALLAPAWQSLATPTQALITAAFNATTIYQHAPDSQGLSWTVSITLQEEAGVAATLTGFSLNSTPENLALFPTTSIPPNGSLTTTIGFKNVPAPTTYNFTFTGVDAGNHTWTVSVPLIFEGLPSVPTIAGVGNAASGSQAFAPGMILSIYGTQLAAGSQAAAFTPLTQFMQLTQVTVDGHPAPLYYVSPTQLNVQIPYEVASGNVQLVVTNYLNQSAATAIDISASAPGIFTNAGALVPFNSGRPGDTLILFITGEGLVAPALADGATPAPTTPIGRLPAPVLPLSVTVGGVNATVVFAGIASGLVGVTQVNFTIPNNVPTGTQPVVVTVGSVTSAPANLTITGAVTSQ